MTPEIVPADLRTAPATTRGRITARGVDLPGCRVTEVTFGVGAVWSEDAGPVAGTALCPTPHDVVLISGSLTIRLEGRDPVTVTAGQAVHVPAGHDAWCAGGEPCVFLEIEPA